MQRGKRVCRHKLACDCCCLLPVWALLPVVLSAVETSLRTARSCPQAKRLGIVEAGCHRRWTDNGELKIVLESMQTPRGISSTAQRDGSRARYRCDRSVRKSDGGQSRGPALCRRWSWRGRRHLRPRAAARRSRSGRRVASAPVWPRWRGCIVVLL
jgi:hypothetical protein